MSGCRLKRHVSLVYQSGPVDSLTCWALTGEASLIGGRPDQITAAVLRFIHSAKVFK